MPHLNKTQLSEISGRTLEHYEDRAQAFWEGTKDHDVSQNIEALLSAIHGEPPYRLLDLGCGPGRDLLALKFRGHSPVGLDGCLNFCVMARAMSGCEVLHQDFLDLDLPKGEFHGIFANASLFHVPSQEIVRVLGELRCALQKGGVLFSSNPRGHNVEGWNQERYGVYHDLEAWRDFMQQACFEPVDHYFRPTGLPRDQQPWLASTWRRQA